MHWYHGCIGLDWWGGEIGFGRDWLRCGEKGWDWVGFEDIGWDVDGCGTEWLGFGGRGWGVEGLGGH